MSRTFASLAGLAGIGFAIMAIQSAIEGDVGTITADVVFGGVAFFLVVPSLAALFLPAEVRFFAAPTMLGSVIAVPIALFTQPWSILFYLAMATSQAIVLAICQRRLSAMYGV